MSLKYAAIRSVFEVLWLSRLPALMRVLSQSRGVIFTLHRVLPDPPATFSPNAILQVRPDFLGYCIERTRALGLDIVTLDEALDRLAAQRRPRPFAVLTFDDAYKDNLHHALPILERHDAPFTLYVPTALVEGAGEVWWQAIEDIIAGRDEVAMPGEGPAEIRDFAQKQQAYDALYWRMRRMPEDERVDLLYSFAASHDYDLRAQCRDLIMDWPELHGMAQGHLCTIGAHTVHHYELAKLPAEEARREMAQSADILAEKLGARPAHVSYPIGAPASAGEREFALAGELGFRTGVTTRPGGLYPHHLETPHALPRISLNGYFQSRRYVDVFTTGAVFSTLGRITD